MFNNNLLTISDDHNAKHWWQGHDAAYWWTSGIGAVLLIFCIVSAILIEGFAYYKKSNINIETKQKSNFNKIFINMYKSFNLGVKRSFTTKKMTFYAAFISMIIVTNDIGGVATSFLHLDGKFLELKLGVILSTLPGALFGPIAGVLCGFTSDSLICVFGGAGGFYHLLFGAEMALTGLTGGFIFLINNKKPKMWYLWTIIIFSTTILIEEWILTPIGLYGLYGKDFCIFYWPTFKIMAWQVVISCLIKLPIDVVLYFLLFRASYLPINNYFNGDIWANRNGKLEFYTAKKTFKSIKNIFFSKKEAKERTV